ncbi:hypothetical protein B0T22DRAFT_440362 [Podospora appendiculata]|uniref:Uncharacterized protein n=1 Tax=Podospora appendiculata TaxID=314037 RepID=A0AAE0XAH3_9PEZI|nr:hypothetical protein B0T22DRAFT_440362 [Podospora appendiculata]
MSKIPPKPPTSPGPTDSPSHHGPDANPHRQGFHSVRHPSEASEGQVKALDPQRTRGPVPGPPSRAHTIPPILHICRLARVAGLKRYRLLRHYTFCREPTPNSHRVRGHTCQYTVPQPTGKAVYVDLAHDVFDIREHPKTTGGCCGCCDCLHRLYFPYSYIIRCPFRECKKLHIPVMALRRGLDLSTGWQPPAVVSSFNDLRPETIPFNESDLDMDKQVKDEFAANVPWFVESTIAFSEMMAKCWWELYRQVEHLGSVQQRGPAEERRWIKLVKAQDKMLDWDRSEDSEEEIHELKEELHAELRAELKALQNPAGDAPAHT